MLDNSNSKIFLFVSLKKYIIAIIDSKNDIILKEEILTNEINNIEFPNLIRFLDSKVFKIEKKFNNFIKNIYLIIDHTDVHSINFSIKNKTDNILLNSETVNNLLLEAMNCCEQTLRSLDILHMKVDQFCIDDEIYELLPDKKRCKNFSIDLSFICMSNKITKNLRKILSKYQISVEKTLSYDYLKNHKEFKNKNIFEIASNVLSGMNENDVTFINKMSKNQGFFEKFFNFFR